ncbi:MAG: anti-sigma regulatory factor [Bacteroidales bacterium]|nr:anti-sigma regulatory factor [Bacteroidales bacterium]
MHFEFHVEGGNFLKAGAASSQLKKILKQLNVDPKTIKRVVVAMYEAEVNIVAHAYKGDIYIDIDTKKIEITLIDEGPGIPDIDLAMKQGFSTASSVVREMGFGAGMGLPNIKNNSDELTITSEVNKGTTVKFATYLNQ